MQKTYKMYLDYIENIRRYSSHTIVNYKKDLEDFIAYLDSSGSSQVTQITYQDIRLYVAYLTEKQYSSNSIARKLSTIRSFLEFCVSEGIIENNPSQLVKFKSRNKRLPEYFYFDEMMQIIDHVYQVQDDKRLCKIIIVELLYSCGIRVSELCQLKINQLKLDIQLIQVIGKGNKERYVPISDAGTQAVRDYLKNWHSKYVNELSEDYLLINQKGKPMSPTQVRTILQKINQASGLNTHMYPHKFRHTFATHLLNNGADMRSVQEMLGHVSLSSTQVYTHLSANELRKAYLVAHPRAREKKE